MRIIGFDAFGSFPAPDCGDDIEYVRRFEIDSGEGIPVADMREGLSRKGLWNSGMIKGNVVEMISSYLELRPELKFALLHVDVQLYSPIVAILENLFDRDVRAGVIVFDVDVTLGGKTSAEGEFLDGSSMLVAKLPISHVSSFVRKT